MLIGPSDVAIGFYLRRPASAPPPSRTSPDRRPDLDKLMRGVPDAFTTADAYQDDARVM
jgi:Holliday junction resolvase RusA-like endonuclease